MASRPPHSWAANSSSALMLRRTPRLASGVGASPAASSASASSATICTGRCRGYWPSQHALSSAATVRRAKTILREWGYGSRWCRQPESLRGSIAARTNENARLRQQLEAAATVVATLHYRRENIGRNGRSRRLVTRGRQDAAFVIVGSVGNSSPEGARRLGRRRRGSGRAGSSLLASWAQPEWRARHHRHYRHPPTTFPAQTRTLASQ